MSDDPNTNWYGEYWAGKIARVGRGIAGGMGNDEYDRARTPANLPPAPPPRLPESSHVVVAPPTDRFPSFPSASKPVSRPRRRGTVARQRKAKTHITPYSAEDYLATVVAILAAVLGGYLVFKLGGMLGWEPAGSGAFAFFMGLGALPCSILALDTERGAKFLGRLVTLLKWAGIAVGVLCLVCFVLGILSAVF